MAHNKYKEITHQKIWQFVWPVLLGNLSIPLLGLVDTALLGHLSDPIFLGAVAIGSTVISMLLWVFGFFKMGVTSLVSQAKGRGDEKQQLKLASQALALALLLGIVILAFAPLLLPFIFEVIGVDQGTTEVARNYVQIRLFAAPFVLGSYVVTGWLLAQQRTQSVLLLLLLLNLLNIFADYIFIWRFGWASEGAAWATVLAEVVTFVTGIILVWRGFTKSQKHTVFRKQLDRLLKLDAETRQLFSVNAALFLRTLCLLSTILWFWHLSASLGESTLAINALLMQLVGLSAFVLDAFAHCAEALTGEAVGMRNRRRLMQILLKTSLWVSFTAFLLSAAFFIFGKSLVNLLSDIPQVVTEAGDYMSWIVLLPLASVLAYHFDGVCLGMGKVQIMLVSIVIGVAFGFLPTWYWLGDRGNHHLWLAFLLFNGFRSLSLTFYMLFRVSLGRASIFG